MYINVLICRFYYAVQFVHGYVHKSLYIWIDEYEERKDGKIVDQNRYIAT